MWRFDEKPTPPTLCEEHRAQPPSQCHNPAWLPDTEPHVTAVPCLSTAHSCWGSAFALHSSCIPEADFTFKQQSEKLCLENWSTHKVCSFELMLSIQYVCNQKKCHKLHSVVSDEINTSAQPRHSGSCTVSLGSGCMSWCLANA